MSGAELFFSAVGPGAVKEADGVAAAMSKANVTSPPIHLLFAELSGQPHISGSLFFSQWKHLCAAL